MDLRAPLTFRPAYQTLVWGGRRLQRWRPDLPPGPIGESWDLSDHDRGMSVVAQGPLAGRTLRELVVEAGPALVGAGFHGGVFPLMVKLIDAADHLSVQVHPDDATASILGAGDRGKTECWVILADGGALFQGTRAGVSRDAFERALTDHTLAATLNRFEGRAGDVFFVEARTVHALGEGCLLYEIQQTSDITFRVYDWDRMGLDGKPRPLHVAESLATIDFSRTGFGPLRPRWQTDTAGRVASRLLVTCPHFAVEQFRISAGATLRRPSRDTCAVVTCIDGSGTLQSEGGALPLVTMQTVLLPAAAGIWRADSGGGAPLELLVASPQL
jgi:mannose-6-phosphate isomerase